MKAVVVAVGMGSGSSVQKEKCISLLGDSTLVGWDQKN